MTTLVPGETAIAVLQAALGYAARGWRVLPLHSPTGAACSCGRPDCSSIGKHPRIRDGLRGASCDADVIATWWRCWPGANVGVATGDGLVVVDVDGEAGRHSLRGRELPLTPTVETGSGWHYYYRADSPLPCRIGLFPSVDVRAVGGYVVAPPSLHVTGRQYAEVPGLWFDSIEMATAPAWLLVSLTSPRAARSPEHWRSVVRSGVTEGARNATVASIAGHMLRRDVDARVVHELLSVWNEVRCRPPLRASEVERTVESIARAEARRRVGGR
jgi:hypothetical protein